MQERLMKEVTGRVIGVCRSNEKGQIKKDEGEGIFKEAHGLIGDAHAGSEKEISLLSQEAVDDYCGQHNLDAPPGSFAENLRVKGISLLDLPLGTILTVGECQIQLIARGKDPVLSHTYSYLGHSLLPTKGVFARVLKGGKVNKGDIIFVARWKRGAVDMKEDKAIRETLQRAAEDGKIPCAKAFQIAEEFKVTKKKVGEILNELGIRIKQCQLGCFP
jgi:MOSC domain-containing protein YiiM